MKVIFEGVNLGILTIEDCLRLQARGYAVAFNDGASKIDLSTDEKE